MAAGSPSDNALPAWMASFRAGLLLLGGYFLIHALLRLLLLPNLEVDQVEQLVYTQSLEWHYGLGQPPLYTWLLWALERLLGPGQASQLLLKYALLLAALLWYRAAADRILGDGRLGLAAVLSLLLLYQFGWKFHHGVTHTALLTAACAASFWCFLRLVEGGATRHYAALGLALGVGALAKYGFLGFAFAGLAAGLAQPAIRRRLVDGRILVTAAVALAVALPYAAVFLAQGGSLAAEVGSRAGGSGGGLEGVATGLAALAGASLEFLSPWILFVAVLFPRTFLRLPHAPAPAGAVDWQRYLRDFLLAVLILLAVLVPLLGVQDFKARWMHPFLLLAPLYLLARSRCAGYAGTGRSVRAWRRLLAATLAVSVLVLALRLATAVVGPPLCGNKCRDFVPFPELASALAGAGFSAGTVIAGDEHIAGNLRPVFSSSRFLVAQFFDRYRAPVRGDRGGCLIIWDARDSEAAPAPLVRVAEAEAGGPIPWDQSVAASFDVGLNEWRERYPRWRDPGLADADGRALAFRWRYHLFTEGLGDCH